MKLKIGLALFALALPQHLLAQEFGRVFSTPMERQRIDAYRAGIDTGLPMVEVPGQSEEAGESASQAANKVRFSGYLVRSDGSQMLWVDGRNELNSEDQANTFNSQIKQSQSAVSFRAGEEEVRLKPGLHH